MNDHDVLAERFEAHRARLRALAYQTLGSASEAEDAVQETWLRLSRADADSIDNLGGWLTTVAARVCLNMLQARREEDRRAGGRLAGHRPGVKRCVPAHYQFVTGLLLGKCADSLS